MTRYGKGRWRTSTAVLQESFIYGRKFKSHRIFMCHTYYSCNHLKIENPVCVCVCVGAYTCDLLTLETQAGELWVQDLLKLLWETLTQNNHSKNEAGSPICNPWLTLKHLTPVWSFADPRVRGHSPWRDTAGNAGVTEQTLNTYWMHEPKHCITEP